MTKRITMKEGRRITMNARITVNMHIFGKIILQTITNMPAA